MQSTIILLTVCDNTVNWISCKLLRLGVPLVKNGCSLRNMVPRWSYRSSPTLLSLHQVISICFKPWMGSTKASNLKMVLTWKQPYKGVKTKENLFHSTGIRNHVSHYVSYLNLLRLCRKMVITKLTPWSRDLPKMLSVTPLVKKFTFHRTWMFFVVFTRTWHWSLILNKMNPVIFPSYFSKIHSNIILP